MDLMDRMDLMDSTAYRAPCTTSRVPCPVHPIPCTVPRAPCTTSRVPCPVPRAPCPVPRAPCPVYRVPCTVYRVPCTVHHIPRPVTIPTGWQIIAVGRIHPLAGRPLHRMRPTDSRDQNSHPGRVPEPPHRPPHTHPVVHDPTMPRAPCPVHLFPCPPYNSPPIV
jgi:hypothetical protein